MTKRWWWRAASGAHRAPLPARTEDVRALHIGGYWRGPNDMVRHMMLGLRAAGAVVHEVNTDERPDLLDTEGRPYDRGTTGPVWLRLSALMDTIDQFHPNLVVCNAGGLGVRPDDAARLRPRAFLLGIALSDPDVFEASTRHVAPHFDAFLTNAPACRDALRRSSPRPRPPRSRRARPRAGREIRDPRLRGGLGRARDSEPGPHLRR